MAVVAARQRRSPAFGRRTAVRRYRGPLGCRLRTRSCSRFRICVRRRARCWLDHACRRRRASPTIRGPRRPKPPRPSQRRTDAGPGDRGRLRLQQLAGVGGRQRADVLQRHQRRGRQGHLRSEDQAASCRRQHPHDRCGRQDHLRQHYGSERRLPRRFRRFAARRHRRRRREWRRPAPTAPAATTPCSKTASTPPAHPAGTIRRSRHCGRSRARASFTTRPTRCCTSRTPSSSSSAFRWRICRISRRPIRP